ncbi:hypothetical protein HanPI659440_Chr11g0432701 [Helianthus annuus]|nr:hypothetical protein HanPI659440_Chr11g0432701 [Helianthus annuus]
MTTRSGGWLKLASFTFCSQIEAAKVAEILARYGVDPHAYGPVVNSLRKDPKPRLDFMMK